MPIKHYILRLYKLLHQQLNLYVQLYYIIKKEISTIGFSDTGRYTMTVRARHTRIDQPGYAHLGRPGRSISIRTRYAMTPGNMYALIRCGGYAIAPGPRYTCYVFSQLLKVYLQVRSGRYTRIIALIV